MMRKCLYGAVILYAKLKNELIRNYYYNDIAAGREYIEDTYKKKGKPKQ